MIETCVGTVREGFKAIRATATPDATIGARAANEGRIGSLKKLLVKKKTSETPSDDAERVSRAFENGAENAVLNRRRAGPRAGGGRSRETRGCDRIRA